MAAATVNPFQTLTLTTSSLW